MNPVESEASGGLSFRPLRTDDQIRLWRWLHIALWDPPPAPLRPLDVLDAPHVRIYAQSWGRPGDVGIVAESSAAAEGPIGACWMRLLAEGTGLAWVDAATPQLGIALEPSHQHRGHGARLLRAALQAAREHGYRRVSLTVHPLNPAIRLYERCGFAHAGIRNTYRLMVARL